MTTSAVIASVVEDLYFRAFDRRYGVHTSGYIPLSQTSLNEDVAMKGHRYRPVNAWAFSHILRKLAPSKELRFVDLGCGLGRACLIAADYGFSRIRGVELVPEFCAMAKINVDAFRSRRAGCPQIEILLRDAVDYSRYADDDIIFLYNPFPPDVLRRVVANLIEFVSSSPRSRLIIYTERVVETSRTLQVFEKNPFLVPVFAHSSWGQAFHVFSQRAA